MSAKISKEVTDLQTSCQFLWTALVCQGPEVAELVQRSVRPYLEEADTEPDFLATIVGMARRLVASIDRLVAADKELYAAKAKLGTLRKERDGLTSELARKITRLRQNVLGTRENPNLEQLGLLSPRSYRAAPLFRQADLILDVFRREDLEALLGAPAFEPPVDLRKLVGLVATKAEELRRTRIEVDETRRLYDTLLDAKDQIKKEHGETFVYTARTFEGYCRLAGKKRLAEKVRPSERRPGRTVQETKNGAKIQEPELASTDAGLR